MTVEQTILAYGCRVTLRATDAVVLQRLLTGMPGRWKPSANGRADRVYSLALDRRTGYVLYSDDVELVRTRDTEQMLGFLIGSAGFYLAERSRRCTFLHSGAVAWHGRAILLPGRAGSGKSTLTAALVRAGAKYLSDDYAPIDDRGRVHPFPRPLSLRPSKGEPVKLEQVERIGGKQETRALPVSFVVIAPFAGARRWRPRRLAPGRAVLELLGHTASAQTRPREALERLGRVTAGASVLKGGRGEADETARLILRRLNATPRES